MAGLPDIAVGYSFKQSEAVGGGGGGSGGAPNVVGMSDLREVHENVRVWREVKGGGRGRGRDGRESESEGERERRAEREACEAAVVELFEGVKNWAWASPPA